MTTEAILPMGQQLPGPRGSVSAHNYSELETTWLRTAFEEGKTIEAAGREIRGPLYAPIASVLERATTDAKAIHPGLTPEHFHHAYYQSPAAQDLYAYRLSLAERLQFEKLAEDRRQELMHIGRLVAHDTARIKLRTGKALQDTPFCYQGQGVSGEASQRTCFNACFRMVFAAITGCELHERSLYIAPHQVYKSSFTHDEDFLKIFSSPTYRRTFPDNPTTVVTVQGADLACLKEVTATIKRKRATARVWGIVNLQSEVAESIWHTNVLLGCNEEVVHVQDPRPLHHGRGENRPLSKEKFHERWAVALNRAHVVISD